MTNVCQTPISFSVFQTRQRKAGMTGPLSIPGASLFPAFVFSGHGQLFLRRANAYVVRRSAHSLMVQGRSSRMILKEVRMNIVLTQLAFCWRTKGTEEFPKSRQSRNEASTLMHYLCCARNARIAFTKCVAPHDCTIITLITISQDVQRQFGV